MVILKKMVFILALVISFSCENRDKIAILSSGLDGYLLKRGVDEHFIENYNVEEIAFFKKDGNYELALKLNEDISQEFADNFSLGIHVYSNNINALNNKFGVWDVKPKIEKYKNHKYIIREFKEHINSIDSIIFFLYDIDKYRGIIGNRVIIRNIKI